MFLLWLPHSALIQLWTVAVGSGMAFRSVVRKPRDKNCSASKQVYRLMI
jgi:hypothetical protein